MLLTKSLLRWAAFAFGAITLTSVVGTVYVWRQLSEQQTVATANDDSQRHLTKLISGLALAQKQIEIDVIEIQRLLSGSTASDPERRGKELAEAEKIRKSLGADLASAKQASEAIGSFELLAIFKEIEDRVPGLWRLGIARDGRAETPGDGEPISGFDELVDALRAKIERTNSLRQTIAASFEQDADYVNWKLKWIRVNVSTRALLMTLWIFLVCLFGLAAVWGCVISPLKEITRALRKLALGNTEQTAPGVQRADEIGELARAYAEFRQIILDRREAKKQIAEQQVLMELEQRQKTLLTQRLDAALVNMPLGLIMLDRDQRILLANAKAAELLNAPPEALAAGVSIREFLPHARVSESLGLSQLEQLQVAIDQLSSGGEKAELPVHLRDDRVLEVSLHAVADQGLLILLKDVSEKRRADAAIQRLAWFDPLTELPNRRYLFATVEQALAQTEREPESFALLFLDLDHFKQINDTQGHGAGDELLRAVAQRLTSIVREDDMVSRLGGDEFVILQRNVRRLSQARVLAERIIRCLQRPFQIGGQSVHIGVSIGVTRPRKTGRDVEALLREADTALYRAKSNGRNTWRAFKEEMRAEIAARSELERDLRQALLERTFEVHFQPILRADRKTVTAFEALLRWPHPERGMVSPMEFIPLAEEMGLIVGLGDYTLSQACKACMTWPDHMRVAVNVSALQFSKGDIIASVKRALSVSGLAANRLDLEITENVLITDTENVRAILRQLRDMGVTISLDDFGTGYSSLSYLHSFPLNRIKIDRSFLREAVRNKQSETLLRGMIRLSRELGLNVVIEGVETEEQLHLVLDEWPMAELQGFMFSPPVPAPQIENLLFRFRSHPAASLPTRLALSA